MVSALLGATAYALGCARLQGPGAPGMVALALEVGNVGPNESLFEHIRRQGNGFDRTLYRQLLGAANEFKDSDGLQGLAASDDRSRKRARRLLGNTRIGDLNAHPVFEDPLYEYIESAVVKEIQTSLADWTLFDLRRFLLDQSEPDIKPICSGLPSDVIGCVVKLMSNDELVHVGQKLFNPLPGSRIGSKGYLGARIQPNSPTDNIDDIRWQVFDGWAYAVGDVVLGSNPVSSKVESVATVEQALLEIVITFGLEEVIPHCVLAHIDVVAEVEQRHPETTGLWFQSLAGVEDANLTFDIDTQKMALYTAGRTGPFALYFETGQGADATNGHGKGFDMVLHEARKYGFPPRAARGSPICLAVRKPAGRNPTGTVDAPERRGRLHRSGGLPHPRTACALLSRRHGHGQTPRPCHRPRHLLHLAHGSGSGRPGLVHRADHAGQSGLPDGAADQERSDAGLPDHRLSGPRPPPRTVRIPG